MKPRWFRWWWLALLVPVAIGAARLRFDADPLDLLPAKSRAVTGLKLYQQHFSNARQLIITLQAPDADAAETAARSIAEKLRAQTNLIAGADWQPPWLEHPEQAPELIAYLWLNQPPAVLDALAARLAATNLPAVLAATRQRLATTLSPQDIAQWSYDPLGFSQLPQSPADFGRGDQMFASADGAFRILYVEAARDLPGYRECNDWLNAVKSAVAGADVSGCQVGYTGRPAFVAEIAAGMKRDFSRSVIGTSVIIAILFWLAHRRIKPMLWLLVLLAIILGATLALGGLIFGVVSVISMGFAAILLGLAVDYAVVHYQEALAQPDLSIPEVRRAIAPSIFWAAITTISAFLVLNFGGLPGLAQLGSLVAIGVALAALVMIFAFLPPLFPGRMTPQPNRPPPSDAIAPPLPPGRAKITFVLTLALVAACAAILLSGLPRMDAGIQALEPRNSPAYAALDALQNHLGQQREPLWLVAAGADESDIAQKLDAIEPVLQNAVSNGLLTGFTSPSMLWPRPAFQSQNRAAVRRLLAERPQLAAAVLAGGFSPDALGMAHGVLDAWRRAAAQPGVFWPSNELSRWIFDKIAARDTNRLYAAAFLYPTANAAAFATIESQLPRDNVWLSSWSQLGAAVLSSVKQNLWKLLVPMVGLVLLSLWLAFRRVTEISLSLSVLALSGLCLLSVMKLAGWCWNALNLMALPLILGAGVDYSIFMQLALRRHRGDLGAARRSVGRALLLCGGTAVAGFGSLGLSSNAGMAGLGRVCAVGIAGNVVFAVFLLPAWWKIAARNQNDEPSPSRFYAAWTWRAGLFVARHLPPRLCVAIARRCGALYGALAPHRRKVVIDNLLPALGNDRPAAVRAARELFAQFGVKLADLWRYESGVGRESWFAGWEGWEHFVAAHAHGRGVLLITPHLGNWEFGGAFLVERGHTLLVLTQREPDDRLTAIRQASRAHWGVDTFVIGEDAFAIVEIIKRLQAGAVVALLVDRPPPSTGVAVELFGRPFFASSAAAELARATGCAILPCHIVRGPDGYIACIYPEISYDRALIGKRPARIQLTQEIVRVFEPAIRQHLTQWFHFVPIWPPKEP